ncbi:sensor histidine kinase [Pararhizobium sp.]|uniref:sensor histidine kinase n=1 Tax=Pararhizobium sp. TaxID=1977563 RepID=UPI002724F9C3|nr:HWE histidine kinase domain-containing protein [Pararhizobium sp.]MDO9416335.1 HWE histidine kinase domain-containing protein [Pararhizobium sp.]
MKKRLVAVALTALMPALGMLVYNEFTARSERSAEVHRQAAQMARQAASEIQSVVEGVKGLLIAVAAIPSIATRDPATCNGVLKRVSEKLAPVRNILVLDTSGKLVCDSLGWEAGLNFGDRHYVQKALQSDGLVVGDYTVARISKSAILPVAIALKNGSEIVGVLATGIRLEWLEERLVERGLSAGGSVTIADRKGVIIARNPDPEKFIGTQIPEAFRHLINAAEPGTTELVSQDGTRRIVGYSPVSDENPLYISAGLSEEEAFAPINRASLTGLVMMMAGAALSLFAAVFVGNRFILHPINHIVSVLQQWRDGDLAARTRMRGQFGELGQVGATVDGLLDELEKRRCETARAEQQRSLMASELSHRVKNTMAIVQAIARQTFKGHSAENAVFSHRVGALAGAYDVLLSQDWKSAQLQDVVERALHPHAGEHDTRIVLSGPACTLQPEAVMALSLITHELATNAIKYGALCAVDGSIAVTWQESGERINFVWTETGGPSIEAPKPEGFGSKLIRSAFPVNFEPKSETTFAAGGLHFHLSFRVRALQENN